MSGGRNNEIPAERERRRSRNRKLALGFFLFVGVIIVMESPLTRVRQLVVTGNHSVPLAAILSDIPIRKGSSLWQVNEKSIQQALITKQPMVQSVKVSILPLQGTVQLDIQERHVVAVFDYRGLFYQLLDDGTIYQQVRSSGGFPWPIVTTTSSLPITVGKPVPDTFAVDLCKQLGQASATLTENVSEVHLDAYGDATLYLNNGFVAQCKEQALATLLPNIYQAIQYFSSRGYQPGVVDMTGAPPYRYTPFSPATVKGS